MCTILQVSNHLIESLHGMEDLNALSVSMERVLEARLFQRLGPTKEVERLTADDNRVGKRRRLESLPRVEHWLAEVTKGNKWCKRGLHK